MTTTWTDDDIADLIADTLDDYNDQDMTFGRLAPHVVAALRERGLLASAALDLHHVQDRLAALEATARRIAPKSAAFATATIWSKHRAIRGQPYEVTVHLCDREDSVIVRGASLDDALDHVADALDKLDPAQCEAEGWATLGGRMPAEHAADALREAEVALGVAP